MHNLLKLMFNSIRQSAHVQFNRIELNMWRICCRKSRSIKKNDRKFCAIELLRTNSGTAPRSNKPAINPLPAMLVAVAFIMSDVYRFVLITELSI